jgi:hypothetical protein
MGAWVDGQNLNPVSRFYGRCFPTRFRFHLAAVRRCGASSRRDRANPSPFTFFVLMDQG